MLYSDENKSSKQYPLTSVQRDTWYDHLNHPGAPTCNSGAYCDMPVNIDINIYEKAFHHILKKYDALNISIINNPKVDEIPMQTFMDPVAIPLPFYDFSRDSNPHLSAERFMKRLMESPFDMSGNLYRCALLKLGTHKFYNIWVCHHLIMDGWSFSLLFNSLVNAYNEIKSGAVTFSVAPSYLYFIKQNTEYLKSEKYIKDRDYWLAVFSKVPKPILNPLQNSKFRSAVSESESHKLKFSRDYFDRIVKHSEIYGASPLHFIIGIVYIYFSKMTQEKNIVIGLPVLNRANAELKSTMGMFISIISSPLFFESNARFSEVIVNINMLLKKNYRHSRFPISDLNFKLDLKSLGRKQLYDIFISYDSNKNSTFIDGLSCNIYKCSNNYEQDPLGIYIRECQSEQFIWMHLIYQKEYFNHQDMLILEKNFRSLVEQVINDMESTIAGLIVQ